MKIHRLTLLASVWLTVAMSLVAFVLHYARNSRLRDAAGYDALFAASVVLIFALNYVILDKLFAYYGRKQVRRMSTILPEEFGLDSQGVQNFKELGEKVSALSQKNSELHTMSTTENYRREYIGNISHELKTPLFSLQGYVETLREGAVENLAVRDKYLQRMSRSVDRLIALAQDLDMINQYEAGKINIQRTDFDLNLLIREVLDLLDLEAQQKEARLVLESATAQMWVNADPRKISQVLTNLVSNAIHYANREKVRIVVKATRLRDKVLVEVSDNGMGIHPEALPRIFERFYRVESSRNRRAGGSGLGLAIVKHILEAHGENIIAESTYLEGTRFYFYLDSAAERRKM